MRCANHDSQCVFIVTDVRARSAGFLVERPGRNAPGCGYVLVENAIAALAVPGGHHRAVHNTWWWASPGRTARLSSGEWIAEELPGGDEGKCYRSPGRATLKLGVPPSVLMIEGDEQLAPIEAGISKPGRWRAWSVSPVPTWCFTP